MAAGAYLVLNPPSADLAAQDYRATLGLPSQVLERCAPAGDSRNPDAMPASATRPRSDWRMRDAV